MNKNIKFIIIILFSLFVFFIFYKGLEKPNNYLPEKNLNKIDTSLVIKNLNDQKEILLGELINNNNFSIINIWASWCLPCRDEHPFIMSLKGTNKLEIIGLNYKDNDKNAKKFINDYGNPYSKILLDKDGTRAIEWGAYGVPETFLIFENQIIKRYVGPLNSDSILEIKILIK